MAFKRFKLYICRCVICSKEFKSKSPAAKTCSKKCKLIHNNNRQIIRRKKNKITFYCKYCGKKIKKFYRNDTKYYFCNRSCSSKFYLYKQKKTLMEKYGVTNAWMLARHSKFSKPQQEILKEIKKVYKGLVIGDAAIEQGEHRYLADILVASKNKIIEFNGTYWHCDPRIYSENYYNKKKQLTAKQIWEYDKTRIEFLESFGYEVLIVWESDYRKDTKKVLKQIMELISDEKD